MKLFFKYAVIFLVATLIALPCGYFYAQRDLTPGSQYLEQISAVSEYETLVEIQYRNADYSHSKNALLSLIDFMNQLQQRQKIVWHQAFANDKGIALMRLALLEEKAGHEEDSRQYIQQTKDLFKSEYHKDYSEEFLRKFVANADSQPEL